MVDVGKVLALDDLLHDVVGIHPGVIHPGRVSLHRVQLPPGNTKRRVQKHVKPQRSNEHPGPGLHLGGRLEGMAGLGGLRGLSGRPTSLSALAGASPAEHKPPEALLPVEALRR